MREGSPPSARWASHIMTQSEVDSLLYKPTRSAGRRQSCCKLHRLPRVWPVPCLLLVAAA
eukprot:12821503-Alexandrium_andersonii.AAC.1